MTFFAFEHLVKQLSHKLALNSNDFIQSLTPKIHLTYSVKSVIINTTKSEENTYENRSNL